MQSSKVVITESSGSGSSSGGSLDAFLIPRMYKSLKRTYALFSGHQGGVIEEDTDAMRIKLMSKVEDEYSSIKDADVPAPSKAVVSKSAPTKEAPLMITDGIENQNLKDFDGRKVQSPHPIPSQSGVAISEHTADTTPISESGYTKLLQQLPSKREERDQKTSHSIVEYRKAAGLDERFSAPKSSALTTISPGIVYTKPEWHAPWKLMRVISGHTGWVRSISVDSSNEWFVTGSRDATIKVWDLASGVFKSYPYRTHRPHSWTCCKPSAPIPFFLRVRTK